VTSREEYEGRAARRRSEARGLYSEVTSIEEIAQALRLYPSRPPARWPGTASQRGVGWPSAFRERPEARPNNEASSGGRAEEQRESMDAPELRGLGAPLVSLVGLWVVAPAREGRLARGSTEKTDALWHVDETLPVGSEIALRPYVFVRTP
jgi:hypothetical protein